MADPLADDQPPGLAKAWGVSTRPRRGPKPGHSLEEIVAVATELADAEGLAAVSLPRLARHLGLSTNALYRYISSKDELLVLLAEAGWGVPPTTIPGDLNWRDAVSAWVHAIVERCRVRPWLLDIPIRGAPVTPHMLRWLETLLESMSRAGLDERDGLACVILVDGYARSMARLARDIRESTTTPVQSAVVSEFLQPRLREHGYPRVAAMMAGGNYTDDVPNEDDIAETDVEFGLNRILDGIEILRASRTSG